MNPERRKYLPAEGYRFLVLEMLRQRGEAGASKGDIAWETRANHHMATRVLRKLAEDGMIGVEGTPREGFTIRIRERGLEFLKSHRTYWLTAFHDLIAAHFQYGRVPGWARGIADGRA